MIAEGTEYGIVDIVRMYAEKNCTAVGCAPLLGAVNAPALIVGGLTALLSFRLRYKARESLTIRRALKSSYRLQPPGVAGQRLPFPSRPEAIRRPVDLALKAKK
jgi:hypothetical protein